MGVIDRILPLVEAGDVDDVDALLRSLDDADRAEARRWLEKQGRAWFRGLRRRPEDGYAEGWYERLLDQQRIEAVCAVALLGPAAAARRVPWTDFWDHQEVAGEANLVHLLWDADRDWAAAFVDTASRVGLGANARNVNGPLSAILRAVVLHHGLPCPDGRTFLAAWLSGSLPGRLREPTPETLTETLRRDPLLPDLLFHYLASGHAGSTRELPGTVATLVAEGRVDRGRVLDVVLAQLTTNQRAASQRVLARVLQAVDLTAAEVPGGLAYLTGVLSTADGQAGAVLLPPAIDLVADKEGVTALTAVVAARPERRWKQALLRALKGPRLREVAGDAAVLEALHTLAESDDDTAFTADVAKAVAALGGTPAAREPDQPGEPALLGLWDARPQRRAREEPRGWHDGLEAKLALILSQNRTQADRDERWAPGETLRLIALGRHDPSMHARVVAPLLQDGRLSFPRFSRYLEDLFLGGAMSRTWDFALEVTDTALAMPRRPAGLEVMLRMLATYAPEAPQQELPRQLLALAAGTGTSRAAHEARALGAALSREPVDDYLARIRAVAPVATVARPHRGLWREPPPPRPRYGDLGVPEPRSSLEALREHLRLTPNADDYLGTDEDDAAVPLVVARYAVMVRDVLAAIVEHGRDTVRELVLEGNPDDRGGVESAVTLWAAGELTVPVFWNLALRARNWDELWSQWRDDPKVSREELQERNRRARDLVANARLDEPVLAIHTPVPRLAFLHACETLLRLDDAPVVLSTPTRADGTLGLDDLLTRLVAAAPAGVGPLDLVQALYRLRPVDPGRAADVADLPPVRTVAALTSPDGDETLDARELLRTWLVGGGLGDTTSRWSESGEQWVFDARVPVPWSVCRAAPRELHELPGGRLGSHHASALPRVLPTWPERALEATPHGFRGAGQAALLARLSGAFGLASHELVLHEASLDAATNQDAALQMLRDARGHGRLDDALLGEAALLRGELGTLALPTTVKVWGRLLPAELATVWPVVLPVAAALCRAERKPGGLAALLRLLASYAHEVAAPDVPPGVRALAEERGSTQSHAAARELVAALTAPGP